MGEALEWEKHQTLPLEHIPEFDSLTTRNYINGAYLVGFSIDDGHLAYIIDRISYIYEYKCSCVMKGERFFGMKLPVDIL